MRKAGKRITHSFFVQPVTRGSGKFPAYSERQVSRLIHLHLCRLPALPVAYWHKLRNYGDEFAQDLHLFPFSPKPTEVALTPSVSYSIRPILPQTPWVCNKKANWGRFCFGKKGQNRTVPKWQKRPKRNRPQMAQKNGSRNCRFYNT
jgi:hypothetical protein